MYVAVWCEMHFAIALVRKGIQHGDELYTCGVGVLVPSLLFLA